MGAEARALAHGGIRLVARAAGAREATVSLGVTELDSGAGPLGRVRRPGGGRKRATEVDPGLVPALLALVEPQERGDPVSPLRWTAKSTRVLAAELTAQGHKVSPDTVGDLLRAEGFSLQGNAKTIEGAQHPDRDVQFRYISEQARACQEAGDPVISVDTKKKELVGDFANGGKDYRPKGSPAPVRTHDFMDKELGKAITYGVYDVAANAGWVNVGTDHDTAAFAVESIRRWWKAMGQAAYPGAQRLLVTADVGGSNSYRTRAWKAELATFALETGLAVTVCHFPPGTSQWNKCVWPGGRPGAMKCSRRPAGRGRRLDTGALRVRNKCGAGPAGLGLSLRARTPDSVNCQVLPGGSSDRPERGGRHGTDPRPGGRPGCAPRPGGGVRADTGAARRRADGEGPVRFDHRRAGRPGGVAGRARGHAGRDGGDRRVRAHVRVHEFKWEALWRAAEAVGAVPGSVRDGPSPPWRASRATAGCEARGRSRSGPSPIRGQQARRRPAGGFAFRLWAGSQLAQGDG
jgi:Rhodopirellula transposase DDE domain